MRLKDFLTKEEISKFDELQLDLLSAHNNKESQIIQHEINNLLNKARNRYETWTKTPNEFLKTTQMSLKDFLIEEELTNFRSLELELLNACNDKERMLIKQEMEDIINKGKRRYGAWSNSNNKQANLTNMEKEKRIIQKIREYREEILDIKQVINQEFHGIEDMFYRFYHQSFKVYDLQKTTIRMVNLFCNIGECGVRQLNPQFWEIVSEGTDKTFQPSHNNRWNYETRPILEAFFHCQHLLNMMEKYVLETEDNLEQSQTLPQGWGSVLYLYNIR